MENNSLKEIWEKLESCQSVVMSLHSGPDGDSLGSCCAIKYVLEKMGKKVKLVSYGRLPKNYENLSYYEEVEWGVDISELDLSEFDTVVLIDCGDLNYFSGKRKDDFSISDDVFKINIDHHYKNKYFGDLNYVDFKKPSACNVLVDLFREGCVEFDKDLGERLLLGICSDSLFFTTENSDVALKDAVFLIENGASYLESVLKPIYYNQDLKLKKYNALVFNKLKVSEDGRFAYALISNEEIKEIGLIPSEVRLVINEIQFLEGFDFVFILAEMEDHIKGSFRSKRGVDVSEFASWLGGGGHKEASAFTLKGVSLEGAEKRVLEVVG